MQRPQVSCVGFCAVAADRALAASPSFSLDVAPDSPRQWGGSYGEGGDGGGSAPPNPGEGAACPPACLGSAPLGAGARDSGGGVWVGLEVAFETLTFPRFLLRS